MSSTTPKTYTPEEIELLLKGSDREIDRLILHSLNSITQVLIPHVAILSEMGTAETIRLRSDWIDAQITKQEKRSKMMDRVIESALIWALPLACLLLFVWFGDALLDAARHVLTKKLI